MSVGKIRRALLSVSDKSKLVEFARKLASLDVELISTGGTRKTLLDAGLQVRDISEVTNFPEMLDGRVKTLHPHIHGGILAVRENADHVATIEQHGILPIDMVVCNLYPFEETVAKEGSTAEEIIENIDIGGPTLVRAAAKNYRDVAVVTSSCQYDALSAELDEQKGLTLETRQRLAAEAFARIAGYDVAIARYFGETLQGEELPERMSRSWKKKQSLRYGENPHQQASFYVDPGDAHACIANAEVLHGKELSYNNILDLDSAFGLVKEFAEPAVVVIKHNNPCGAATASNLTEAFVNAYEGDPQSAFGGILAFNRPLDEETATQITEPGRFIECVIAPRYSNKAFELLTTRPTWKKSVRILSTGEIHAGSAEMVLRQVEGGMLVQQRDTNTLDQDFADARVVTKREPSEQELADLKFAWMVGKHVKSNAIVLARQGMIVGVGAGQMSRVDSVHLSVRKAGDRREGAVLASDAFFPFRDNVDEAARAGITAIVQPGGSKRDEDSIQACDEHNLAMIFTGVRHFRH